VTVLSKLDVDVDSVPGLANSLPKLSSYGFLEAGVFPCKVYSPKPVNPVDSFEFIEYPSLLIVLSKLDVDVDPVPELATCVLGPKEDDCFGEAVPKSEPKLSLYGFLDAGVFPCKVYSPKPVNPEDSFEFIELFSLLIVLSKLSNELIVVCPAPCPKLFRPGLIPVLD